jgi:hypothetical protein
MAQLFSLRQILIGSSKNTCVDESDAVCLLQKGLQDGLVLLVAMLTSEISKSSVPPGFTERFEEYLTRPTLGGLRDFIVWTLPKIEEPHSTLWNLFIRDEKGGKGWIGTLIQVRNRWMHPEHESREELLPRVLVLISEIPDYLCQVSFASSEQGELVWLSDISSFNLAPFAFFRDERIVSFTHFEPPYRLSYGADANGANEHFRRLWFELRIRDQALEKPTAEEIRYKAKKIAFPGTGDSPWWFDRMLKPGPPAILLAPGQGEGLVCHLKKAWPNVVIVDLVLDGKDPVLKALACKLGLASAPASAEFLSFSSSQAQFVLILRAAELVSRDFLQTLYWLADLMDAGSTTDLRILIERSGEKLQEDQSSLFDRLPGNLSEILRKPKGSSPAGLVGYLWSFQKNKRFWNLF